MAKVRASLLPNLYKDAAKLRPLYKNPNYMYTLYLGGDKDGERKAQGGWKRSTTIKNKEKGRRLFCMWANGFWYGCMTEPHYWFVMPLSFLCAWVGKSKWQQL